jgi:hypothetical protein
VTQNCKFANRIETVIRERQGVASALQDGAGFRVAPSQRLVKKSGDGFKSTDEEFRNGGF